MKFALITVLFSMITTVVHAPVAHADVCSSLKKSQAEAALDLIRSSKLVYKLEKGKAMMYSAEDLDRLSMDLVGAATDEAPYQLKIGGLALDLAYTFVEGKNLGITAGCESTGDFAAIPATLSAKQIARADELKL